MHILNVELYIYNLQQNINSLLLEQINNVTVLSFFILFIGGILTSFSPCMLSCILLSITYINQKKQKSVHGLFFLFGILTSILVIGISGILARKSYLILLEKLPIIIPLFTILLGLNLLKLIELNFFVFQKFNPQRIHVFSVIRTYCFGLSIGLNISACTTPILMTLVAWISVTKQITVGMFFLGIYTLGYILPIFLSILSINYVQPIQTLTFNLYRAVTFSGFIVIIIGTFTLFNEFFILL
jgi:cytochrome c-type biogenesis protein